MAEDVIKVGIDDTELDMLIAKLKQSITLQSQMGVTGTGRGAVSRAWREWRGLERTWSSIVAQQPRRTLLEQFGEADLPSINRNLRVLLNQIPGMRNLQAVWFRIRWLQRGVRELVGAEALTISAAMPLILTLLATIVIIQRGLEQRQRNLERMQLQYEMNIRRAKGWTREEFIKGTEEWESHIRSLPG